MPEWITSSWQRWQRPPRRLTRGRGGVAAAAAAAAAVAALGACSVDPVTFRPLGEPVAEDCAVPGDEDANGAADCADPACAGAPACRGPDCEPERCDGLDNDCSGTADDGAAIGTAGACAAASCADIRDRNPASASGVWWIAPGGGPPFEAYCDQTSDGGGWALVWRNHGGSIGGAESNAALLARAAAGTGDAIVLPQTVSLTSAIHQELYDAYWAAPQREWIKLATLWDGAGQIVNQQRIRVELRGLSMQQIFAMPVNRCIQVPERVRVTVNDTVSFGETDIVNHYTPTSFGLASTGNNDQDLCGQPASNLISDPDPGGGSLFRRDGGGSTNAIRHLFSYVHTAAGRDASRCLYACWEGDLQGYYDGFVWAVR